MEDFKGKTGNFGGKISTLVFMDLESTGLPSDVGKKNVQITEMSLVAVDRSSFEEDKNLRILNKVNLCIRPRSVISPFSMDITGLYNDTLASQEEFDESVPKLLEYFFRRLQRPICLLAHNGNNFDFPLLQAELNRIDYTLVPELVCADTLVAFRSICALRKEAEALDASKRGRGVETVPKTCKSRAISEEDIDSLLSKDLESFANIENVLQHEKKEPTENKVSTSETKSFFEEKIVVNHLVANEFLSQVLDEQTPKKHTVPSDIDTNVKIKRKRKILDPTYTPQTEYKKKVPAKRNIPAKRTLFTEHESSFLDIHKITKFSLQSLYNHFFNENPPNSHYAEVDTISLSKVCQKINKDFLQWIDENSVSFSSIHALW